MLRVVLLVLVLAGCVSTHAKSFIGRDVRQVMLADGPPVNAFDYGEGQRVFQFYWGGGSYSVPSQTTGSYDRSTGFFSASTIGGGVVSSRGCLVNYFTRWNEGTSQWMVESVSWPDRLVC
jgi:hypothetical protein